VTLLYADTSAIVRAYLRFEPDHAELRKLLLDGPDPIMTTELTRVEFTSAVAARARARKVRNFQALIELFDADCGVNGSINLLRLNNAAVLSVARRLVTEHALRTLDAIHLAVALTNETAIATGEPMVLVTRDRQQAAVAKELGMPVL
jgi:uncharacterized protein